MGKITRITQVGAKGVIFVSDPMDTGGGMLPRLIGFASRGSYSLEGQQGTRGPRRPGNMFFITPSLANSILASSGKNLTDLQKQINRSGKPASFELPDVKGKINLAIMRKPVPAENIVGMVEGSDPVLKNECIVYVAHYDHLGVDRQGEVYNGADDNASGVAGLLEIAEAFNILEKKPKRSVVFAWVTGEEIGLLGSLYYSQHPVIPLEKTVACIDLDMIGRVKTDGDTAQFVRGEKNLTGRNGIYVITGGRSAELDSLNSKICAKMGLKPDDSMSQAYINRSDYAHFHRKGIPILGFSTGIHTDYHMVTDEISKLDFPKMRVVTELAFRVGYAVADKKERIVVDKPVENK
jgi:Zn-dependent M28 family amino/carboxypeptidase